MENKNFGLTEEAFKTLVVELQNGNEEIFQHIFLSHFENSMSYLKRNCSLSHEQSYDACMDTLIEFRKRLIQNKVSYGNLNYLFTKMASQRFFKNAKKDNRYQSLPDGLEIVAEEMVLDNQEIVVLNKAWNKLGESCQTLLKRYYYDNVKLIRMAEEDNKKPESMRKQKQRCLNTLRINFQSLLNV